MAPTAWRPPEKTTGKIGFIVIEFATHTQHVNHTCTNSSPLCAHSTHPRPPIPIRRYLVSRWLPDDVMQKLDLSLENVELIDANLLESHGVADQPKLKFVAPLSDLPTIMEALTGGGLLTSHRIAHDNVRYDRLERWCCGACKSATVVVRCTTCDIHLCDSHRVCNDHPLVVLDSSAQNIRDRPFIPLDFLVCELCPCCYYLLSLFISSPFHVQNPDSFDFVVSRSGVKPSRKTNHAWILRKTLSCSRHLPKKVKLCLCMFVCVCGCV